jgi:hypothetical protein
MKTAIVTLESASPYSQSRLFTKAEIPAKDKESHNDYEIRNWRNKQHWDQSTGIVYIPPMALKNALMEAAQYLGEKVPGKRNATWTKHFMAGVLVSEPVPLGVHYEKTDCETFMCHADGKRGSGTRVPRTFPVIREWKGKATFYVMDETITQDAFLHHLEEAGKFIGLGRFRPRNGGFYGRFHVTDVKWE